MEEELQTGARLHAPEDKQIKHQEYSAKAAMENDGDTSESAPKGIVQEVAQEASNTTGQASKNTCEEQGLQNGEIQAPRNDGQYTDRQGLDTSMDNEDHQDHSAPHALLMPHGPDTNGLVNSSEDILPFPNFVEHQELPLTQDTGMASAMTQDEGLMSDAPYLDAAPSFVESEAPRIQAFAKLEFDDGEFYMNTYSVDIGRDIEAARIAAEMEQEAGQSIDSNPRKRSASAGDASRTPKRARRDSGRRYASSVISERGGIIGIDFDRASENRRKSKSTTSSSQFLSRKSSVILSNQRTDYQALAMASLGELYMEPRSSMPHPDACPLVPIHPPTTTEGAPTGHKGISRRHVKIAFNFEKHLFEVTITGRNGAFVDEEWYPEGDTQPLKNGSFLQIGGVGIRFLLPDVALGETGAESSFDADPATGGKMSFDFDDAQAEHNNMADSNEVESDDEDGADDEDDNDHKDEDENGEDDDDSGDEDDDDEAKNVQRPNGKGALRREEKAPSEDADEESEEEVEGDEPLIAKKPARKAPKKASKRRTKKPAMKPSKKPAKKPSKPVPAPEPEAEPMLEPPKPKRKGPGRPPKNGIISKREQALQARLAREAAKAAAQEASGEQPLCAEGKNRNPDQEVKREDGSLQPNGKRKYKKRKSKADLLPGEQDGIRESTEHTDSVPPEQLLAAGAALKPPKEKRPPKPPRSPSPVYDESTMTPEQLAKPNSSYVVLIHEALTNSKTGAMSLPQIYRAIERKYPFYKLRVQTTGWQSSVRHNLSQHPAFRKIERDGKGWMWGLVPEVSIEKEKKRRQTPPPMPPQHYYPPNPQMMQPQHYYSGMPPPNGYPPGQPGQPPYGMYPAMPPGHMHPPPHHLPPPRPPKSISVPLINAQADTSSTYQSPYQSAPRVQPPQSQTSQSPSAPQFDTSPQQNGSNGYTPSSTSRAAPPVPSDANNQPTGPSPSSTPYSQQSPRLQHHSPYSHHPQPQPQALQQPCSSPRNTSPHNSSQPSNLLPSAMGPDFVTAVHKFKHALIDSMEDNPRAEFLVTSAINRTLGISNFPGLVSASMDQQRDEDEPQIQSIMQALSTMLENLKQKTQGAARLGSQPPGQGVQGQVQRAPLSSPAHQGSQVLQSAQTIVAPTAQMQQAGPPVPGPPTAILKQEGPKTPLPSISAPTLPSAPAIPNSKTGIEITADSLSIASTAAGMAHPLEAEAGAAMDARQPEAKEVRV